MRVYNCTAHNQSDTLSILHNKFGIDVEIPPRIKRVNRNKKTKKIEMADLEKEALKVAEGIPPKSNCLVGGAGPLIEKLSLELLKKDCHLFSITSRRKNKQNGGFKFNVLGFDETPLSKAFHSGEIDIKEPV